MSFGTVKGYWADHAADHGNADQHPPIFPDLIRWKNGFIRSLTLVSSLLILCSETNDFSRTTLAIQSGMTSQFILTLWTRVNQLLDFTILHHIVGHRFPNSTICWSLIYIYILHFHLLPEKSRMSSSPLVSSAFFSAADAVLRRVPAMDAFSPCRIQTPQSAVHARNEKDANSPMKVPVDWWHGKWWLIVQYMGVVLSNFYRGFSLYTSIYIYRYIYI